MIYGLKNQKNVSYIVVNQEGGPSEHNSMHTVSFVETAKVGE